MCCDLRIIYIRTFLKADYVLNVYIMLSVCVSLEGTNQLFESVESQLDTWYVHTDVKSLYLLTAFCIAKVL
jgi:hypothetical protein